MIVRSRTSLDLGRPFVTRPVPGTSLPSSSSWPPPSSADISGQLQQQDRQVGSPENDHLQRDPLLLPSRTSSPFPQHVQGSSSTVLTGGSSGFSPAHSSTSPTRLRSRLVPQTSLATPKEEDISSKFLLHPDGNAIFYWTGVVAMATVFNTWTVLLRIAYPEVIDEDETDLLYLCDLLSDAVYLCDISVQMRTAFMRDGIPVYDSEIIRHNYVRQAVFIRDVIAIFPTETISIILPYFSPYNIPEKAARLNRLLKLHSIYKFYDLADSRTSNPNGIRAFRLTLSLATVIHWIGCLYYVVSEYEGLGINQWVYTNNTEKQRFLRKYVVCLYWSAMTLTTIGDCSPPETDLEYVFTGLTFLIGVFVFATVVGNVGDVIANMNATRQEFQSKMDQIKLYLTHRKVPASLQIKVKKWAEYSWSRTQATDEYRLLHMLPERLRAEIAVHVHLETLCKVKIFQNCEQEFLCELVLKLRSQIYSPGDFICRAGETGREMYIINHGKVEVVVANPISGEEVVVAVLTEGNYFGEISLLRLDGVPNKRTADVRSVGYSELLCLSRKDLMAALVEYPEAKTVLEQQARERIKTNLQAKRTFSVDNLMGVTSDLMGEPRADHPDESLPSGLPQDRVKCNDDQKGKDLVEIRALIENLRRSQNEGPIQKLNELQLECLFKEEELRKAKRKIAALEATVSELLRRQGLSYEGMHQNQGDGEAANITLSPEVARSARDELAGDDSWDQGRTIPPSQEVGEPMEILSVPGITINDTLIEQMPRFAETRRSFYRGTPRFYSLDESLTPSEDPFLSAPRHRQSFGRRGSLSSIASDISDNQSRKSSLRSDVTGDEDDDPDNSDYDF